MSSGAPNNDAPPPAIDERLRRAAALVYVDDLAAPQPRDDDAHHLINVLRLRAGEPVIAADGKGGFVVCEMATTAFGPRRGRGAAPPAGEVLQGVGEIEYQARVEPELRVGFAIAKGDRAEWTVQKLTEIGIDRITPILTERTVVRLDTADSARRGERFRRIAKEAGAQSRRVHLPVVDDPVPFESVVESLAEQAIVAIAEPGGAALSDERIVLIGPEGGWSPRELDSVRIHVHLGPNVLRAETAALVAGTLLVSARERFQH